MDRHVANAEKLLCFLKTQQAVHKVYYPGLHSATEAEIQKRQAKNGGAMISIELNKGYDSARFFSALRLIALAESLGGVDSLACHPETMTHAAVSPQLRQELGITKNLIRLSVGIENIEDLIADLKRGLDHAKIDAENSKEG